MIETIKNIPQCLPIKDKNELPSNTYMVYILATKDKTLVVGHGKLDRAKIIFDDLNHCTYNHIKSFFVRLYILFEQAEFHRFIIACDSKGEAIKKEKEIHRLIGGNTRSLSVTIQENLFSTLDQDSKVSLYLRIALVSSFSGMSDLRNWRKEEIINETDWNTIIELLRLRDIPAFNRL